MSKYIDELLASGESQTLEIKEAANDPSTLAKLICSFANGGGGKILVGFKSDGSEVIGVEELALREVFKKAILKLTPKVEASLDFIEVRIVFTVAIIEVSASQEVVLADGGAYLRSGNKVKAMASSQIMLKLQEDATKVDIESLANSIEQQTNIIDSLHQKIVDANSWQAQWKSYLLSGVVGFVFSMILAFFVG